MLQQVMYDRAEVKNDSAASEHTCSSEVFTNLSMVARSRSLTQTDQKEKSGVSMHVQ